MFYAKLLAIFFICMWLTACSGIYLKHDALEEIVVVPDLPGVWLCGTSVENSVKIKINVLNLGSTYTITQLNEDGAPNVLKESTNFRALQQNDKFKLTKFFFQATQKYDMKGYVIGLIVFVNSREFKIYRELHKQKFLKSVNSSLNFEIFDENQNSGVLISSAPPQVRSWLKKTDENIFDYDGYRCIR